MWSFLSGFIHSAKFFESSSKLYHEPVLYCLLYNWAIFCCMNIPHLFSHLAADEHLGYFHIFAIVSNDSMNIYVCMFCVGIFANLRYVTRDRIARSYGNAF